MKSLIFLILVLSPLSAVIQLEVQPPCDDAYVHDQEPTLNFGASPFLFVLYQAYWQGEFHIYRTLVKFDGLPQIPEGTPLGSCYLELHVDNVSYTGTSPLVFCYVLTSEWNEETVTWNNQPTMGPLMDDMTLQGMPSVIRFNITSAVHDWYENSSTNHGLELRFDGKSGIRDVGFIYSLSFRSKEFDTPSSPKLILMCCETGVQPSSLGNLKALYH
jgi:hypothetical protein